MKRTVTLLLALLLTLSLAACGEKAPTWQEQYDLGQKYLTEGNYEEAILAFTAAIEIDPKRPEAYLSLADAYEASGDPDAARKTLEDGLAATNDPNIQARLDALSLPQPDPETLAAIDALDIPFEAGGVTLGVTSIETVKNLYASYPNMLTNLMNDDADDTVYTCYGMNDTPIPEWGYEDEFGILFVAPVETGIVSEIIINDRDISFCGGLANGMDGAELFRLFHLDTAYLTLETAATWETPSGRTITFSQYGVDYRAGGVCLRMDMEDGVIWGLYLSPDANEAG